MAQGIAWDKEKVIEVLRPFFQLGSSITKACKYAGISQSTVQTWIDNDEELRLKIDAWQSEVSVAARKTWKHAIESGNTQAAFEWMKRKEKDEFSEKTETDITSKGEKLETGSDVVKELANKLNEVYRSTSGSGDGGNSNTVDRKA